MENAMFEISDVSLWYESWCTGIQSPRFYKWLWIFKILIVAILTQILLTLLTSICLINFGKILICRRWFLFGVSYYVNFTPWRVIRMDNNTMSKIWVWMSATYINLLQFKIHWLKSSKTYESVEKIFLYVFSFIMTSMKNILSLYITRILVCTNNWTKSHSGMFGVL